MTCEKFESVMGYHCSPVLMGMKPANLVSFSKEKIPELPEIISDYEESLEREGIGMEIICGGRRNYLLLVYRPDMLQEYLKQDEARKLLLQDGYNIDGSLDEMIARLKERFFYKTEFPHEIGLFLGYPIEDVKGFRKFGGSGCKMCGYWKVYDDVESDAGRIGEVLKRLIHEILKARLMGDTDLNGVVDTKDSAELLKYNAELRSFTEEQEQLADVNGDGTADSGDVAVILQYAAEKIVSF